MEIIDNNREKTEKYLRAQKRVENIRGFYVHLLIYFCINIFISSKKISDNLDNGETFQEAFFDIGTFVVWLAWGIGLAFHAFNVFIENGALGRQWEERKIKEYMEQEKNGTNENI